MANFDVEYDCRTQYHWDDGHLDAELRLPEGMAIALTELANILPNAWSRVPRDEDKDSHKMLVKAEILSLTRQYYDAHIVGDDQRAGEVALQWRSVVAKTVDIVDRPKVLTPHFLEFIEERIKKKIMKRGEKNTKFLTVCYNALHYIIQNIGFYVYKYDLKDCETGRVIKENQSFVIPCHLPFKYDTRGQRKKFKLYPRKPDLVEKK